MVMLLMPSKIRAEQTLRFAGVWRQKPLPARPLMTAPFQDGWQQALVKTCRKSHQPLAGKSLICAMAKTRISKPPFIKPARTDPGLPRLCKFRASHYPITTSMIPMRRLNLLPNSTSQRSPLSNMPIRAASQAVKILSRHGKRHWRLILLALLAVSLP